MEDNRRKPSQPTSESEFPEVILEPIQDIGLPKKRTNGSSLSRKRKKRRRQQRMIIALGVVIALVLSVFVYMFISNQRQAAAEAAAQIAAEEAARAQQEKDRQEFEALANATTFLEGITVNGIDIGGMTMDEARTALNAAEANIASLKELQLVYDNKLYPFDISDMPITLDIDSVLKDAYKLGKSGDLAAMKAEVAQVKASGHAFTLTVSYDLTTLNTKVANIATQIDVPAQNAKVAGIDSTTHTLAIQSEVVGHVVDQNALITAITDSLMKGSNSPINIPVIETQPTITSTTLQGSFVMRASATTDFSTSTSARKYNVKKGAGLINGTVVAPGEVFSTNDTLGTRTSGNGWKMANAYESGAVVPQAGGGVCQLSTTLYNAVVKADLEVVSRRNHSMPVHYIKEGLDATINSVGNIIDFQFKNNTTSDLIVIGYTEGNKLTFEIWGVPFATTEYDEIKLTSSLVSTNDSAGEPVEITVPAGTEKPDGSLIEAGQMGVVVVTPRKGYVYQSYKNYYLAGTLVKKEKLAVSTYKAFQGEIWNCPGEVTPSPEITPEPIPEVIPPTSP